MLLGWVFVSILSPVSLSVFVVFLLVPNQWSQILHLPGFWIVPMSTDLMIPDHSAIDAKTAVDHPDVSGREHM